MTRPHRARQIRLDDGRRVKPGLVLGRLVEPGKLREFLDTHGRDEFAYDTKRRHGQERLNTIRFRRAAPGREWQPAAPGGQPAAPGREEWQHAAPAAAHAVPPQTFYRGLDGQPAAPLQSESSDSDSSESHHSDSDSDSSDSDSSDRSK